MQKYIKWFNNYTQQDISYKYNMGLSITNKYLQEIIKKGYLSKEDIPTNKCYPRDYILKNNSEIIPYWSKNNALKIDEITPFSLKKYKWICEDCGCEFEREIGAIIRNNSGVHCRPCGSSKGEYKIKQWLDKNNIEYITQKTFDNLIGMGRGLLSYDFYLPQYNLLIEFQGEQHERFIKGFHIDKKGFKKQQEHDRRKKEYARKHNIKLLEIWYYDESNIGDILKIY